MEKILVLKWIYIQPSWIKLLLLFQPKKISRPQKTKLTYDTQVNFVEILYTKYN